MVRIGWTGKQWRKNGGEEVSVVVATQTALEAEVDKHNRDSVCPSRSLKTEIMIWISMYDNYPATLKTVVLMTQTQDMVMGANSCESPY